MVDDVHRKGHTEGAGDEIDLSTIYGLLSHSKRRALLHALDSNENSMTMADAAEEVVRLNSDTPNGEIAPSKVEKCSISLYHRHVPKLTDNGVVTIDEGETLSLTEKGEQLIAVQENLERQISDFS